MLDFCSITPALIWHHTVSDSEQQTAASSSLFMICLLLLWRLPKMSSRRLRDACPDRPLWNQFCELITGSTPQPYLPQQTIDYLSTPCVTLDTGAFCISNTRAVFPAHEIWSHIPSILCSDEEKEGTVCLLTQLQKMKYNQEHLMNLFLNKNSKSALILCSSAATGCHSMSHQCKCVASYFLMSVCNHSRSAARCTCWGGNYWQPLVLTRCVGLQSCEVISLA